MTSSQSTRTANFTPEVREQMIQRAELRAKLIEEQLQREAQAQDEAGVRVDEHDAEISSKMERTMRKIYGAEPRNTMTSTQAHGEPRREASMTESKSKHTAGFAPEVHEQMIQRAELRAKLIEEQLQREAQAQDEAGVPVDEHDAEISSKMERTMRKIQAAEQRETVMSVQPDSHVAAVGISSIM
eukprot:TRINITY_DN8075_c1_g2_i2.p2 TRINITY_DN8075_c1_g2~~TRINITY_DN8075_c1_g2_i2.p2  ORF type:complete len:185 (-),score=47.46 TRINITY_DN8075_c1_g2_i2:681-1235(-)